MGNINILILSVGTRNKIVQYFKETIVGKGKIICTDMSIHAPAIYEGDKYYLMPPVSDENYINKVLDICDKENIAGIFSLIDPELAILSEYESQFKEKGILLLQSPKGLLDVSFNKYEFFKSLTNKGYKTPQSYIKLDEVLMDLENGKVKFPLFIKPNRGSASININSVFNKNELISNFQKYEDLLIQEYIDGDEYGVDVYVDFLTKEVISIFIKKKLKMRAGETDKSISIKNKELNSLIKKFVEEMNYVGQIDIDVFESNNEFYISEVNPRFGGGYPHAYIAGCNFPLYIYNNLRGIENKVSLSNYKAGSIMMKYNEIKIMNNGGI